MPKTLLLADDSVTIQKVVGISFANEDVKLVTVDNGDDAVARARELRPDIVLADVVMPGMNGYEVCETIKSDPALAHIPVLLLTGTFEAFDDARAARAGADGHITKPFEAQALVDTVNARLAAGPARPAAPPAPQPAAAAAAASFDADPLEASSDFFEDEITEPSGTSAASVSSATTVLMREAAAVSSPAPEEAFGFDAPGEPVREPSGVRRALPFEPDATLQRSEPLVVEPDRYDAGEPWEAAFAEPARDRDEDALAEADTAPPEAEEDLWSAPEAVDLREPEPEPAEAHAHAPWTPSPAPAPRGAVRSLDDLFPGAEDAEADLELETGSDLDGVGPDDLAGETLLDPAGGRDYDVSSSDLGDPFAAPQPPRAQPQAVAPAPRPEPAPVPAAAPREAPETSWNRTPAPAPPAAAGGPARTELSPAMRQQLHEALEKIAWEAFSDVSERIVRDALDRVEAVAWEVIPQMAEALVREEIRRLKGED